MAYSETTKSSTPEAELSKVDKPVLAEAEADTHTHELLSNPIHKYTDIAHNESIKAPIAVKKTKSKKKCGVCRIKLQLVETVTGKCQCSGLYCNKHRLPELHDCQFDHKSQGRVKLRQQNQKVVTSQLEQI